MMTYRSRAVLYASCVLAFAVAGCEERGATDRTPDDDPEAPDAVAGVGEVVAARAPADGPRVEPRPRRIYYDLTAYEWYRKGEPLRVGAGEYVPEGAPQAMAPERMRRVAEYEGVDVYVPAGVAPPYGVVFVPVFRRYWQPFILQPRSAVRAD